MLLAGKQKETNSYNKDFMDDGIFMLYKFTTFLFIFHLYVNATLENMSWNESVAIFQSLVHKVDTIK